MSLSTAALLKSIKEHFADDVGLTTEQIFDSNLTLGALIAASSKLHNSLDLMEAFARLGNRLRRETGVTFRLPVYPLDTSISLVFSTFATQIEASSESC